jgi:hypothetical protein
MKLLNTILLLAATALTAACATPAAFFSNAQPNEIYYKDGRIAYVASCRAVNWGPCLEKAGAVCKNAGYTVLEKTNSRSYGEDEKELVFSCNANSGEGKPASGVTKS